MPRLRAINVSKLKNRDKAEAVRVVKDLLMLTPRGESQRLRANAYTKYNNHYSGKEACLTHLGKSTAWGFEPNERTVRNWGYEPTTVYYALVALGLDGRSVGEWEARKIIRNIIPADENWGKAKLTRSARRLERRLCGVVTTAVESGKLGDLAYTASVRTPEVDDPGGRSYYGGHSARAKVRIAAASQAEAQVLLDTMFKHAVERTDVGVSAWQVAEPAMVLTQNMAQVDALESQVKQAEKQIAALTAHIQNIKALQESMVLFSEITCKDN
jgi:hypothetical protein